jgi:hypothetical protein
MKYPSLSSADAKKYLTSKRSGEAVSLEPLLKIKGQDQELNDNFIDDLQRELGKIRQKLPELLRKGEDAGPKFEAAASEVVHRNVPNDQAMLADPEFWMWLAVAHFGELIEWRYGNRPEGCNLANYGIGASGENFVYRLWLRAELGIDEDAQDRYHLARRGDVDFWRSHLFRQGYANVRTFARALIKFQYPDSQPERPRLKIAAIRELVKRLRRLRTNLLFELLAEDECIRIIEGEAEMIGLAAAD